MKKIAAVFAHPDDLEIWAGGTIKKHLGFGDQVRSYVFFEINDTRKAENDRAMALLGIEVDYVFTPPYQAPDFEGFIASHTDIPDLIITHWNEDTHLEHQLVFSFSLLWAHHLKRYRKQPPILLMASSYTAQGYSSAFNPSIIIDISDQMEAKKAFILCHQSQKPEKILTDVTAQNTLLGIQVKTPYAEGFLEYPLFGYKKTALRNSFRDFID